MYFFEQFVFFLYKLMNTPKVYLSLTTSPKRIDNVVKMLRDINLEHFDKVMVNLPLRFGRNGTLYVIPKSLQNFPKVQINRFPKDFGPLSKVLPTLLVCKNPNDIIISIDDDIHHDNRVFPLLINNCKEKDVVVTGIGKNLNYWSSAKYGKMPRVSPFEYTPKGNYVDLLEGFSGVSYKRKFFPDIKLLVRLSKVAKNCYLSDDLVLSFYLKLFGRRILSLHKMGKYGYEFSNTPYKLKEYKWGVASNALHKGGGINGAVNNVNVNKIKYPKCYAMLRKYHKKNENSINKIILRNWHHDYDKIYIINMKNKPERKAQSIKILKMLHVPSTKIKILNASTPSKGESGLIKELNKLGLKGSSLKSFLGEKRHRDLKWHESRKERFAESKTYHRKILIELAVSISQLRVIKHGMDNNETVLMLEDDFGPTSHFYNIENHKLHRQVNWETLYLGDCSSMRSGATKTLIRGKNNKLIQRHTVCHHSLAFRPSMGKRLLQKKPIVPFDFAIDDELGHYLGKYKVPFAIFNKPLMVQDVDLGTKSNIQEANKLAWELEESNKFGVLNLRKL